MPQLPARLGTAQIRRVWLNLAQPRARRQGARHIVELQRELPPEQPFVPPELHLSEAYAADFTICRGEGAQGDRPVMKCDVVATQGVLSDSGQRSANGSARREEERSSEARSHDNLGLTVCAAHEAERGLGWPGTVPRSGAVHVQAAARRCATVHHVAEQAPEAGPSGGTNGSGRYTATGNTSWNAMRL